MKRVTIIDFTPLFGIEYNLYVQKILQHVKIRHVGVISGVE